MIINFDNTQLDIPVDDNSYRYRAIKGEHSLTLYYSLPEHIEIPLGAWCEFQAEIYTLERPENFTKHGTRNFEYTLIMEAAQAKLKKYKFRDTTSQKLKFSLTAKPQEHLKMLVDNLNQREQGWQAGECIEAVEKVISYNHTFCSDALSQIADAFETEYEITGKTIHLRKIEHNKDNPLPLSYGRGNGFRPGLGRSNYDNSKPVEILFVQGGERNIDASKYGSIELLLPKRQTLEYEGRQYISDADGFSIRRADKGLKSYEEDSLDCSHIYPSRVGTVSAVEVVDAEKHFYDFVDNGIPGNLDFEKCLIDGETMTVIFQSGMLTGKEFDVKYKHAERRFEIVPQELDGRTMPDNVFKPAVGDTYAVFGMMMPDAYICDNETQTGASWDMFREAAKYLYENEEQKFSFTGELDGIWAKKDWLNIGGRIVLGGYVLFSDTQFQQDGIPIRIIGIKDYINDPYKPSIELSNAPVGSSFSSTLRKIDSDEVIADDLHREALQFTKRRFRDAQETAKMLQSAMLVNFTNSISPLTVQTMQLLAGDESLQFRFVDRIPEDDDDTPEHIVHEVTFGTDKVLHSVFHDLTSGVLQHMTIGITDMKNAHTPTEYKYWTLPQFDSPPLAEADKKYYLYAKCSKDDTTGKFVLSEMAIGMEAVAGHYHFLVALVNSEYDGERSVITLYGFSEILPGRVTTDRIVSADGKTYFDLANSKIGGLINFIDGLVSGDIGIGNETGINAGMSGFGNAGADIRLWAGETKAKKGNAPFRVTHDGLLIASNAEITGKVNATSGEIGGFEIGSGRIGVLDNDLYNGLGLYNEFIKFSESGIWAGIGTNVLPASTGLVAVGRLENQTKNSYGTNYGLVISVKNALNNIAIAATGDIICNGFMADYPFTIITPAANTIHIPGDTTTPSMFKILAKFVNSNSGIGFPTRNSVASKLNISTTTPFAVKMIIIGSAATTQAGYIRGRNTETSGMETTQYAQRLNNDGGIETGKLGIAAGDVAEFMLVWDGSNYYAYLLNYRN
jgi:hypothetical protein